MASVNPIGLDIGSSSIRAVEVRRAKDEHLLTNFGQVPLPPGTVQGGVPQDPGAVTSALKQLWAACKFNTKQVRLGVTNPQLEPASGQPTGAGYVAFAELVARTDKDHKRG